MSEPWFKKAFEEHYTHVYAHRDENEAIGHLPQIIKLAQLQACRAWILDLGCGQGRYGHLLKNAGYKVCGLDYSKDLLLMAQQADPEGHWLRGNMLHLPFDGAFERILSCFTSFGYFDDDQQNIQVLREMAHSLKLGGLLYLDYLNPYVVKASDWTTFQRGPVQISSRKVIAGELNMVHKNIRMVDLLGLVTEYQERVKLYDLDWFQPQALKFGLVLERCYGDYQGQPLELDSPRQIMVFKKN